MKYNNILIAGAVVLCVFLVFLGVHIHITQEKEIQEEAKKIEEERLQSSSISEDTDINTSSEVEEDLDVRNLGREKKHELVWYVKGSDIYHTTYERCDAKSYKSLETGEYTKEVLWDYEDETDKTICSQCYKVEENRNKPSWLKDPGY